jgi:hypothetical protein
LRCPVEPNKISLWIAREHSTAVSIFAVLRETEQRNNVFSEFYVLLTVHSGMPLGK